MIYSGNDMVGVRHLRAERANALRLHAYLYAFRWKWCSEFHKNYSISTEIYFDDTVAINMIRIMCFVLFLVPLIRLSETGKTCTHKTASSSGLVPVLHMIHNCIGRCKVTMHKRIATKQLRGHFNLTWDPFYWHGLTLIPAWISNYMPRKVWDEIIYLLLNFNGATVEV